MTDLYTAGETMVALSNVRPGRIHLHEAVSLSVAGAESTVAIGISRLGHTAQWVGRVGQDAFGRVVLSCLRGEAVDVSGAVEDPDAPTGVMVKEERLAGRVRVHYHRRGSAGSRFRLEDIDEDAVSRARLVHLSGITPALSAGAREAALQVARLAAETNVPVSLDVNYRPALWAADEAASVMKDLATSAAIVFGSADELALLARGVDDEDRAAAVRRLGPETVVVKSGARGAWALTDDGVVEAAAVGVEAVDHVGAGDAFVAGFLSGVLDDEPLEVALHRACVTGAFSVGAAGDWEGLPARDELMLIQAEAGFTGR